MNPDNLGNCLLHKIFSVYDSFVDEANFLVSLLINAGVSPNTLNLDLHSPLHIAVLKNQTEAV